MAQARGITVNISASISTTSGAPVRYSESFTVYAQSGMDHIEALARVVTEIEHFKTYLDKSVRMRITAAGDDGVSDSVPSGPAGESPD